MFSSVQKVSQRLVRAGQTHTQTDYRNTIVRMHALSVNNIDYRYNIVPYSGKFSLVQIFVYIEISRRIKFRNLNFRNFPGHVHVITKHKPF